MTTIIPVICGVLPSFESFARSDFPLFTPVPAHLAHPWRSVLVYCVLVASVDQSRIAVGVGEDTEVRVSTLSDFHTKR